MGMQINAQAGPSNAKLKKNMSRREKGDVKRPSTKKSRAKVESQKVQNLEREALEFVSSFESAIRRLLLKVSEGRVRWRNKFLRASHFG